MADYARLDLGGEVEVEYFGDDEPIGISRNDLGMYDVGGDFTSLTREQSEKLVDFIITHLDLPYKRTDNAET